MLALAVVIELRHLLLQLVQLGIRCFGGFLGRGQLLLQVDQARLVGRGQGIAVSQQALAALGQLAALFFDVALVGGQHLDLLLHLGHAATLLAGAGLGLAQGFFELG